MIPLRDHPVSELLLRYGEYRALPEPLCSKCGAPAQVGRFGESLCRSCALDSWHQLSEPRRLELLGFERI